jgi:hypothetical protein
MGRRRRKDRKGEERERRSNEWKGRILRKYIPIVSMDVCLSVCSSLYIIDYVPVPIPVPSHLQQVH